MPHDVQKAKHIRYKMTERADLGDAQFTDEGVEDAAPYSSTQKDLAPVVLAEMDLEGSESDGEGYGRNGAVVMPENSSSAPGHSSQNIRSISPRPLVRKNGVQNWGRY